MVAAGSALLSSIEVGPRTLRNRVWMTAHGTSLDKVNGPAAPAYAAYYRARAAGGVGAITVPYDPSLVAAYDTVVPAVHEHGTLFLQQIAHSGKQTDGSITGLPTWSPSAIPDSAFRQVPHAMTKADLATLRAQLRRQVEDVVRHGLDGAELHAAHGYLLGQFLSPATNHRRDEYGGSLPNRMRFVRELLDIFGEVLPAELIRGVRINGSDGAVPGGLGSAEWCEIAQQLVDTYRIDYLSVSHGTYWHSDRQNIYAGVAQPPGYQLADTAAIKRVVGAVPVVAVGRILRPEQAVAVLEAGQADIIGMARALIADPEWVNKAANGDAARIRTCIGDNFCVASLGRMPITCVLNPWAGREYSRDSGAPEESPGRVAVVGGGPGGMHAALTIAEQGGSVCLYEKAEALGGQLRSTAIAPSYGEFANAIEWYATELARAGVQVLTSREATAAELTSGGYDAVIVATGSVGQTEGRSSLRPSDWLGQRPVPTHQAMTVTTCERALEDAALLPTGRIVVFDDLGDRRMPAVAETLRSRGHAVTAVTPQPMPARLFEHYREHPNLMASLKRLDVEFACGYDLTEIAADRVHFSDVHTGAPFEVRDVSGVVLITGNRVLDDLVAELERAGIAVYPIGDCVAPRGLAEAIREAELVVRRMASDRQSTIQNLTSSRSVQ